MATAYGGVGATEIGASCHDLGESPADALRDMGDTASALSAHWPQQGNCNIMRASTAADAADVQALRQEVVSLRAAHASLVEKSSESRWIIEELREEVKTLRTDISMTQAKSVEATASATAASQGLFELLRQQVDELRPASLQGKKNANSVGELEIFREEIEELKMEIVKVNHRLGTRQDERIRGKGESLKLTNSPARGPPVKTADDIHFSSVLATELDITSALPQNGYTPRTPNGTNGNGRHPANGSRGLLTSSGHDAGIGTINIPYTIYSEVLLSACMVATPEISYPGAKELAFKRRLIFGVIQVVLCIWFQVYIILALDVRSSNMGFLIEKLSGCSQIRGNCQGIASCCTRGDVCGEVVARSFLEARYANYDLYYNWSQDSWYLLLSPCVFLWLCATFRELLTALQVLFPVIALPSVPPGSVQVESRGLILEIVGLTSLSRWSVFFLVAPVKLSLVVLISIVGLRSLLASTRVYELVITILVLEFVWQIEKLICRRAPDAETPKIQCVASPRLSSLGCNSKSTACNLVVLLLVSTFTLIVILALHEPSVEILNKTVMGACAAVI